MNRLHEYVGTQLRTFGRCAMMGALIGLMTTQAFAASAPAMTSQPGATPETTTATTSDSTQVIAPAPATNLEMNASESATPADAKLPEAPAAPKEQASVTKPLNIKAIMDDAAGNTQNLQPTTSQQKQHQIHPGWLALTAVGGAAAAFGILVLAKGHGNGVGPVGGTALGIGGGLAGLGLYLTFK